MLDIHVLIIISKVYPEIKKRLAGRTIVAHNESFDRSVLQKTMADFGLKRGENGLKVIGMCEIPANIILADDFLNIVDGFSIGTNDLTQLTLGVDRDSELVAHVYDEENEAVKRLVKWVIDTCNSRGKYIGICGQIPSDSIDFAKFIVKCGIQTMSLNPDTMIKTTLAVAEVEKELGINPE